MILLVIACQWKWAKIIPDDKPSTVSFMTLIQRYRKLDVDITGNGNVRKQLAFEDILCKILCQPQNGGRF